jgi:NAD(P)-dependent dehydrogenase (short-subunit alcohol dehydrogenase family)
MAGALVRRSKKGKISMKLFDLTGKVAIVTGSSKGIGLASAKALAAAGARVAISSRKQDACDAAADLLNRAHGAGTAIAVAANISHKPDLERLVGETHHQFGAIDVLVCNAATNPYYGPSCEIGDDQFQKVLHNNILSNHWLVQMVAPDMRARKNGSIILISSIGGMRGSSVIGAYNVSKAADFQLARNYAVEFGPDNVRVNCIAPGLIKTDFARALWEDPQREIAGTATTPLRRIGQPEEIAGAVVYLAAPAGSYMTGQVMIVDGGATA